VEEAGVIAGGGVVGGIGGSGTHRQGGAGREVGQAGGVGACVVRQHGVGPVGGAEAHGVDRLGARWGSRAQGLVRVHQGVVVRLDIGSR
jgi:hypothetical protein